MTPTHFKQLFTIFQAQATSAKAVFFQGNDCFLCHKCITVDTNKLLSEFLLE